MITFEIDHIDFSSINCCSNLHRRNKKESEKQRERERNKVKENGEAFFEKGTKRQLFYEKSKKDETGHVPQRERGFLSSGSQWMLKLRVLTSTEMFHFYSPPWPPVSSIPLCFSLSLVSVSSIDLRNFPEYYTGVSFPEFFFSLKRDPFHFSPFPTTSLIRLHFPTPPQDPPIARLID